MDPSHPVPPSYKAIKQEREVFMVDLEVLEELNFENYKNMNTSVVLWDDMEDEWLIQMKKHEQDGKVYLGVFLLFRRLVYSTLFRPGAVPDDLGSIIKTFRTEVKPEDSW